jgi:aspartyl-tRNA(Asn)/glutamyl-tRNA(Gln) amidotransferase subunit A
MYMQTRGELFGPEVRRRILLGTFALSAGYFDAWYKKALAVRRLILDEFLALFSEFDLLAGPVSPFPAFALGSRTEDPYAMYLCDLLTAPVCLAGLPSISVPCGLARGSGAARPLPVGLQFVGRPADDHRVLAAAAGFEAARGEPERCEGFAAPAPAAAGGAR